MSNSQYTINNMTFKGNLRCGNTDILDYKIDYPQIQGGSSQCMNTVNNYYRNGACSLKICYENKLFCQGVKQRNQLCDDFLPYEAIGTYEITYNQDCTLSLFYDKYEMTGGAHGNTVRCSDTWNMRTCKLHCLADFFDRCVNYRNYILDNIKCQIENQINCGNNYFFDDWENLICQYFDKCNFYLTPGGVNIYYQLYEIAPYVAGIISFCIPFDCKNVIKPGNACCRQFI